MANETWLTIINHHKLSLITTKSPLTIMNHDETSIFSQGEILITSLFSTEKHVAPCGEVAIVASLMSSGEVVAMTGDGVNDAPALKSANVAGRNPTLDHWP